MSDNVGKFALGLLSLVVLWVAVYWWWEPSEPPISFGASPVSHEASRVADPVGTPTPGGQPVAPASIDPPPGVAQPQPQDATAAQTPVRPVVAVTPPEFAEYTVRPGDTLRTISIKYFGTASQAAAIARANPLMDPSRLRAGRILRVPKDPANIQGRPVPRPTAVAKAPSPPASGPGVPRSYTVRPGDTLSAIAQDVYGSIAKADLIYNANRDKMKDRDELRVGMVLTIPAAERGD